MSLIIAMDANSKLGPQYIPKDPHAQSPNGEILGSIIERHALVVANGSIKCPEAITRKRATTYRTEESCIDLVMISTDMNSQFMSLHIDKEKKHVLTRITKSKNGIVTVKESDHNVLITTFENVHVSENKNTKAVFGLF